jgi:hypothetical protein
MRSSLYSGINGIHIIINVIYITRNNTNQQILEFQ